MANTNYPSASSPTGQQPVQKANNGGKNVIIGLLAVALLGISGYLLWDKNKNAAPNNGLGVTNDQQMASALSESDSLRQMFNLSEMRLDSITGANNGLQGEKTALQQEIESKKREIRKILSDKNASDADLKRARGLIFELNNQIVRLESEVTHLRGENQELTVKNSTLTTEKEVLNQNLATRNAENNELSNTIDVGSTLSASGMTITPIKEKRNGKEVETNFARRVDKLNIAFTIENRITTSGPADLYVIVTNPEGKIIQTTELGSGAMTTRQDGDRNFTAKVPVEYEQGTRKGVSFPVRNGEGFKAGDYKIEVYHNGFKIGESIRTLKKGLFG